MNAPMRLVLFGIAAICAAPTELAAQGYRAARDTLQYRSMNSYLMYFVRGSDTLGQPVTSETLETMHIGTADAGLRVWVLLSGVGDNTFRSEETYSVTANGRVTMIGGQPPAAHSNARVDLLPRFSDDGIALAVGQSWTDTVSAASKMPYGHTYYEARRSYRVLSRVDTVGRSLLLAVSEGRLRLRQGGWQDSTAGTVWWQEVAGPVVDSVWFDPLAGVLVRDVTVMDLVGKGGAGPPSGGVVMASGLRSSIRRSLLEPQ